MTREMRFTIRERDAGKALVVFLAERFTYHDEAAWRALVAEQRVRVNGRIVPADAVLATGDEIRYEAEAIPEPPVDTVFGVVSDDPLLLVVNKPGNLPCHPGGRYFNHTLWALLKERCGLREPVFVNRIDRETSGLVVVAKTPGAAHNLSAQFSSHRVVKRYTVFVEGHFPVRADACGWLCADTGSAVRKKRRFVPAAAGSAAPEDGAEWAETLFERERICDGFSVVTATPRTGRLHQLRATLLALGFPVVGDKLYGVDETLFLRFCAGSLSAEDARVLRLPRQALHAGYLCFRHPRFGSLTELSAPLPTDMVRLLEQSGKSEE